MAIKYTCPKCNRRFTQWGAEKFGFKCPSDKWRPKDHPDDIELVRLGPSDDRPAKRAAAKKGVRKPAVSLPVGFANEGISTDAEDLETAAEFQGTANGLEDADADDEDTVEDDVVPEVVVAGAIDEVVPADAELGDTIELDDADADADTDSDAEDSDAVPDGDNVEEVWKD